MASAEATPLAHIDQASRSTANCNRLMMKPSTSLCIRAGVWPTAVIIALAHCTTSAAVCGPPQISTMGISWAG